MCVCTKIIMNVVVVDKFISALNAAALVRRTNRLFTRTHTHIYIYIHIYTLISILQHNGVCVGITNIASAPVPAAPPATVFDTTTTAAASDTSSSGGHDGDSSPYDVTCDTIWCLTNIATGVCVCVYVCMGRML